MKPLDVTHVGNCRHACKRTVSCSSSRGTFGRAGFNCNIGVDNMFDVAVTVTSFYVFRLMTA